VATQKPRKVFPAWFDSRPGLQPSLLRSYGSTSHPQSNARSSEGCRAVAQKAKADGRLPPVVVHTVSRFILRTSAYAKRAYGNVMKAATKLAQRLPHMPDAGFEAAASCSVFDAAQPTSNIFLPRVTP